MLGMNSSPSGHRYRYAGHLGNLLVTCDFMQMAATKNMLRVEMNVAWVVARRIRAK